MVDKLLGHWIKKKILETISYGQLTIWGDNEEWLNHLRANHMVSSGKEGGGQVAGMWYKYTNTQMIGSSEGKAHEGGGGQVAGMYYIK